MVEEKKSDEEKMKEICTDTAEFRKEFYQKLKKGWMSMLPLEDIKMVHFLYRIFYMAPNDQEVQSFEWHNFFDTFHDFPMRKHGSDPADKIFCASMADIVEWFKKSDGEKKCLRRVGNAPRMVYCLGCKTEEEKEFVKKAIEPCGKIEEGKKEVSSTSQSVNIKAANRLGMSVMESVDVASRSNRLHKLMTISNIAFPLRRTTSALLYPVTEGFEMKSTGISKSDTKVVGGSGSSSKMSATNLLNNCAIKKKDNPKIVITGENGQLVNPDKKLSIKDNHTLREVLARRANYEKLLKASEWLRIDDEMKVTLVEIKIRQRLLLIDHYITGWQKDRSKDVCLTKWLHEDAKAPLHTRRFANFEYYHFIPSHSHSVLTQLDQKQLMKYRDDHAAWASRCGLEQKVGCKIAMVCAPKAEPGGSEVFL